MFKKKPDVSVLPIGPILNSQATNNTPDVSVLPIGTILKDQNIQEEPRRFGTTYRPHPQQSRRPRKRPLKMKPTGSPETSV